MTRPPFSPRAAGALLMALGLCLAFLSIAIILRVDGLPVQTLREGSYSRGRSIASYYYYAGRHPTAWWAVVGVPVFVAFVGLIQLAFGRSLRDLPKVWHALEEDEQRLIVYSLLIAVPALILWLTFKFS